MDWKTQMAVAYLVKQDVATADEEGLWPHHLPEVAASEEALRNVEGSIGEPLDKEYRSFLEHANGWQGFFQAIDLFGTEDLLGGERMKRAQEILRSLGDLKALCGVESREVLPIGVSRDSSDLIVIDRYGSESPGTVRWLAGGVVDTFPNFEEFFLAMIDYNREEIDALRSSEDSNLNSQ